MGMGEGQGLGFSFSVFQRFPCRGEAELLGIRLQIRVHLCSSVVEMLLLGSSFDSGVWLAIQLAFVMAFEHALHDVLRKEDARGFEFADRLGEVNQVPIGRLFEHSKRSLDGHAVPDGCAAAIGLVNEEEVGVFFQRQGDGRALARSEFGETRGVSG